MQYFDAVLTESMRPIFNGTPEETKQWLRENTVENHMRVCDGRTMQLVTISEYLSKE